MAQTLSLILWVKQADAPVPAQMAESLLEPSASQLLELQVALPEGGSKATQN